MKPVMAFALTVGASVIAAAGAPVLGQQTGLLTSILREVKRRSVDKKAWQIPQPNAPLDRGDAVRTGRRSAARIAFLRGSKLALDENSAAVMLGIGTSDIALLQGGVYGRCNGPVVLRGPRAVIIANRVQRAAASGRPSAALLPDPGDPRNAGARALAAFRLDVPSTEAAPAALAEALTCENPPGGVASQPLAEPEEAAEFEYRADGNSSLARCYSGVAYRYSAASVSGVERRSDTDGVEVRTGTADVRTATTLADPELVNQATLLGRVKYLYVTSPTDLGQRHTITAFDPATGTITVGEPFAHGEQTGIDYFVTNQAIAPLIIPAGVEVTFRGNQAPRYRSAFPQVFAGGAEFRWWDELIEGRALKVYTDTRGQEYKLGQWWPLSGDGVLEGSPSSSLSTRGSAEVVIGTGGTGIGLASVGPTAEIGSLHPPSGRGDADSSDSSLPLAVAAVSNSSGASSAPGGGFRAGPIVEIDPYVIGASPGSTIGSRNRLQMISGRVFAEVGELVMQFRSHEEDRLSEGSLLYRSGNGGDLRVGRQHLFLGPANNGRLGALMDSNTVDGVVWSAPASRSVGWRAGYLRDNAPLGGEGYSSWFGRGYGLLGEGIWGLTIQDATHAGGGVGASADLSLPLLANQLDGYVEFGRDSFDRDLTTGGLYFPGLFQRSGVDAFLEYQRRQGQGDRVSFRLSSEFAPRWLAVGYLVQDLNGKTTGGVGLSHRWHWQ